PLFGSMVNPFRILGTPDHSLDCGGPLGCGGICCWRSGGCRLVAPLRTWRASCSMSFDRLAPHYRWMEFLLAGKKLQHCRTAFLSQVEHARDVLILGEGNGRFLAECRYGLAEARITCVDASARMLQLAHDWLRNHGLSTAGINFVHADALAWNPPRQTF